MVVSGILTYAGRKNCMSLSFDADALLPKIARTSCMPWLIRDTGASDMIVDPELYSTIVSIPSGYTYVLLWPARAKGIPRYDLNIRHHLRMQPPGAYRG
jgi:hypothetical protein